MRKMPSSEDSKKRNDQEDAVSLDSNPPAEEAMDASKTPPTPPDAGSPPPEDIQKEAKPEDKHLGELKPGDMVGVYRIEKIIGRGGMASVYRAFDVPRQRVVALKVLRKRFTSSSKAIARFDREFLALESFEHRNIIKVLDKGIENDVNYFVMEYVDGASLARLLRYRDLTFNTKAQILLQVAGGLDYAHRRGVVHRDVKPDNVLIDRTGRAKIADFGIAQITRSRLPLTSITVTSSFMGTADYMAPEQRIDAKTVDHRADIYSFGVMLYETLTGRLPLGNFPLPSQLNPELTKRMDGIILRALRQDPEERYQSMAELADDLKREIETSRLSRLKARLALIMQTESWKMVFSFRTLGTVSLLFLVIIGVIWLFSTLGNPFPPASDRLQPGDSPSEPPTTDRVGAEGGTAGPISLVNSMVLIPAGEFIMGNESGFANERPRHKVFLDAYYIDTYEVTNAEYKKFVDATGHAIPRVNAFWAEPFNWRNGTYPPGKADHPVVLVDWKDATAFAKWAGKRLPSEAEWEKAARGPTPRPWPWGNEWDVHRTNTKESFINSTASVFLFPEDKSPYGVCNMAGNVMEWTADWYDESYYAHGSSKNPRGPSTGTFRVVRGGAWDSNINLYARTGFRHYFLPEHKSPSIGFRCVKDVKTTR